MKNASQLGSIPESACFYSLAPKKEEEKSIVTIETIYAEGRYGDLGLVHVLHGVKQNMIYSPAF